MNATPKPTLAHFDYRCENQSDVHVTYLVMIVPEVTVSLPANVVVLWLLIQRSEGLASSDLFPFNLALTEIINCLTLVALAANIDNLEIFSVWSMINFFIGFIVAGRPLAHCCICLERYMAVVHPIAFVKYKSSIKYRLPFLVAVWISTVLMCVANLFLDSYELITTVAVFNLSVGSFCSLSILWALKQPRPGDGERGEMALMKRRAFAMVLFLQSMVVINHLPIIFVTILKNSIAVQLAQCKLFPIAIGFFFIGNFVNPLIYLFRDRKVPCFRNS